MQSSPAACVARHQQHSKRCCGHGPGAAGAVDRAVLIEPTGCLRGEHALPCRPPHCTLETSRDRKDARSRARFSAAVAALASARAPPREDQTTSTPGTPAAPTTLPRVSVGLQKLPHRRPGADVCGTRKPEAPAALRACGRPGAPRPPWPTGHRRSTPRRRARRPAPTPRSGPATASTERPRPLAAMCVFGSSPCWSSIPGPGMQPS